MENSTRVPGITVFIYMQIPTWFLIKVINPSCFRSPPPTTASALVSGETKARPRREDRALRCESTRKISAACLFYEKPKLIPSQISVSDPASEAPTVARPAELAAPLI